MSGGGGSGGGQMAVVTGPTIQAAQSAEMAQVNAANAAANVATENSQKAINALMQQYTTGLGLTQPIRAEGNQAAAQLNYMLGLPAAAPGTAPTPVNLQSEISKVTPDMVNSYINRNSYLVKTPTSQQSQAAGQHWEYTGVGANDPQAQAFEQAAFGHQTGKGQFAAPYEGGGNALESYIAAINGAPAASDFTGPGSGVAGGIINNAVTNQLAQQQLELDLPTYHAQQDAYNQATNIYNQYNAKGTATAADIGDIIQNQPGFQFTQQQGINQIQNSASASGMLNSGSILQDLNKFGQGLSSTYYQNYLNNLQGLAGLGLGATQQAAASSNQLGANIAGAYDNLTTNLGNAYLAAGQAQASSYLSPAANQQIIAKDLGGGGGGGGLGSILGGVGGILSSFSGGGAGGGLSSLFSSKLLKEDYQSINTTEILDKVSQLDIEKWKYKGIDRQHIGPYAEQFQALFGVGDGRTINMIDVFGVMLGSIKQLTKEVAELKRSNQCQ